MRRSWNIARRVYVGSACVDRSQSPLTYLFQFNCYTILHARRYASAVFAVIACLSVCLSVVNRYCICIKTAKRRISKTTPYDSPETSFMVQKNYTTTGREVSDSDALPPKIYIHPPYGGPRPWRCAGINNISSSRSWLITVTVQLTSTRLVVRKSVDGMHGIACSLCVSWTYCNDACTKPCRYRIKRGSCWKWHAICLYNGRPTF